MKIIHVALLLIIIPALLFADSEGDVQSITLKDTSVIRAKVIAETGGFCRSFFSPTGC